MLDLCVEKKNTMQNSLVLEPLKIQLNEWRHQQKMALELMKTAGELIFDRSVELTLFRRDIYDSNPSTVIKNHLFAQRYINKPITLNTTLLVANAIQNFEEIRSAKIDLGKLAANWIMEQDNYENVHEFIGDKLLHIIRPGQPVEGPTDVILYGFGRIGRLLGRLILSATGKGEQLLLKAIVLRPKLKDPYEETFKRFSLLLSDSIHGDYPATFTVSPDGSEVTINGNVIRVIYANNPQEIDYTQYGIHDALLIDNTGVWRDHKGLSGHMRPGVKRVMLTAPGKDIPNIVYGINEGQIDKDSDRIISAASCTTNAISPVIKVIDDTLGIEHGHIETIHAYTVDQNLLDNFHKKPRRGRAAAINMVLTTTGAAKAVARVLPHLDGVLTGNAVRVPVPDVSLAILNLAVKSETNVEEVNAILKEAAIHGDLVEQIHYSDSTEYVSSHAIGMTTTSVIDAPSTIVSSDKKNVTIYAWYDNEYGYACQVVRLAKVFAQVNRPVYH